MLYVILFFLTFISIASYASPVIVDIPIDGNPYMIKNISANDIIYQVPIKSQINEKTGSMETVPFTCTITTKYIGGSGVFYDFNFVGMYSSSTNVTTGRPAAFSMPKYFISTTNPVASLCNRGCNISIDGQICQAVLEKNDGSPLFTIQCNYLK